MIAADLFLQPDRRPAGAWEAGWVRGAGRVDSRDPLASRRVTLERHDQLVFHYVPGIPRQRTHGA
jgi:hypothetical protein